MPTLSVYHRELRGASANGRGSGLGSGPAEPRSGGDDYLVVLVDGIPIEYGIEGADGAIAVQIESLRDTGAIVRVWGQVSAGLIDWNSTQILVERLEVALGAPAAGAGYEGWKLYLNAQFGYALWYPGDCQVMGSSLNESVQFSGPLVEGEHWPVLTVSHLDNNIRRPPDGVDVETWLDNLGMPYDEVVEIAGLPAAHTRFEGGGGAYANDEYAFIVDGQLFRVYILHTGGKEDWALYDRFLQGLTFLDR